MPRPDYTSVEIGDILWAVVLDPNRKNPKDHPVVILKIIIADGRFTFVGTVISGSCIPVVLPAHYFKLPHENPPRRHPATRLNRRSVAKLDWIVTFDQNEVIPPDNPVREGQVRSGFVPTPYLNPIVEYAKRNIPEIDSP